MDGHLPSSTHMISLDALRRNLALRLGILLLMVPLTGATIDIYVPSLPAITTHFGVPVQLVQWTIPSYLMGYSLAQLFCGALSDAWGRRALLIMGLGLYTGASCLAAFSPSITVLIVVRFAQGLGVAAPGVLARAIASDSFASDRLPAVTNYITLAWALGPILAPLIGGYLQHVFGWKAVFYFLTAYGCLVLAVVYFLLPETNAHRHPPKWNELLADYRIVLASPVFLGCALVLSIIYAHLILFNVVGPFLVQVVLHESPLVFGRVALTLGVAWFLGSLANRFLTAWFPKIPLMEIATLIAFLASLLMGWLALRCPLSLSHLVMPTAVVFMTGSITFTQCFGKSMRLFPERAGTASALMGTLFIAGSALAGFAASFLETQTGIPLALSFIALTFLAVLIQRMLKLSRDASAPDTKPAPYS
jgi:MFS transporter, DHA1 family, multidrug resistance protein